MVRLYGTLLDANTFLTAGHCTYGIGSNGEDVVDSDGEIVTSGGTDVWVTFEDARVVAGLPDRADYPTEEALYEARSGWLDSNPDYITGTAHPNPDYDNFSASPLNHDVGIVELDEAAPVTTYAMLAPLDTARTLVSDVANPNDALVESVGYGIQAIQPDRMEEESLYKSTSRIVEVKGNASRGGNLHTSNNPSSRGGRGGTCFGDSGGPVLVNNTDHVLTVCLVQAPAQPVTVLTTPGGSTPKTATTSSCRSSTRRFARRKPLLSWRTSGCCRPRKEPARPGR